MFANVKDLLNFEQRTLKWVALIGFWFKIIFLIFKIHFAPRGTTHNLTFLNTQNRPTLLHMGPAAFNHSQLAGDSDLRDGDRPRRAAAGHRPLRLHCYDSGASL